jgi:uncharacterized membrane protein
MPLLRLLRHVRSSLWFVPVACVLAGGLLSFGTIALDRSQGYKLIPTTFTGGPDAALAILSTVAASMVSLTALVLTVTMVVVQLAMGQFSPRIVQPILQDKPSQLAIGIFVATFAHAMLAMREVTFPGGEPAMDWDAYVRLAFDEIRIAGAGSPQVSRRLAAALTDLKTIVPPDRIPALDRQLDLLSVLTGDAMADDCDVEMALRPDRLGIGVEG